MVALNTLSIGSSVTLATSVLLNLPPLLPQTFFITHRLSLLHYLRFFSLQKRIGFTLFLRMFPHLFRSTSPFSPFPRTPAFPVLSQRDLFNAQRSIPYAQFFVLALLGVQEIFRTGASLSDLQHQTSLQRFTDILTFFAMLFKADMSWNPSSASSAPTASLLVDDPELLTRYALSFPALNSLTTSRDYSLFHLTAFTIDSFFQSVEIRQAAQQVIDLPFATKDPDALGPERKLLQLLATAPSHSRLKTLITTLKDVVSGALDAPSLLHQEDTVVMILNKLLAVVSQLHMLCSLSFLKAL